MRHVTLRRRVDVYKPGPGVGFKRRAGQEGGGRLLGSYSRK